MATVAVTDHPFPHLDAAQAVLEPAGHDVVEHDCSTAEEVARACADADGAGAGLDVLEQEPPHEHRALLALDQVVVTPHVAFYSEASLIELQRKAAEQLRAMLAGERPTYLVNPSALRG